jgi:hypothetical protein
MPRSISGLSRVLEDRVGAALTLAEVGEAIRSSAAKGSMAKRELYPARLEALYEMTLLRMFSTWEAFLEATFLRYLCGYASSSGPMALLQPRHPTMLSAEVSLLGNQDFLSWSKPISVVRRSQRFFASGLHEIVIGSHQARLEWFAAIRHRVAHDSSFSRQQFDAATMGLVGRRYPGSSPGRFLRDWNRVVVPPERWIQTIGAELKDLSRQIAP